MPELFLGTLEEFIILDGRRRTREIHEPLLQGRPSLEGCFHRLQVNATPV